VLTVSKFIQVGVTAMRDPLTGEPLEAVPLYVEQTDGGHLPEINIKDVARDFLKKMKLQKEAASRDQLLTAREVLTNETPEEL